MAGVMVSFGVAVALAVAAVVVVALMREYGRCGPTPPST
jgi:hypothetical protein